MKPTRSTKPAAHVIKNARMTFSSVVSGPTALRNPRSLAYHLTIGGRLLLKGSDRQQIPSATRRAASQRLEEIDQVLLLRGRQRLEPLRRGLSLAGVQRDGRRQIPRAPIVQEH